jgi:hypothetical protein
MKHAALITAAFLMISVVGATHIEVRPEPGLIGPEDGPLWQIDKTWDSLTKNPGEIAAERASEAQVNIENNNTEAAEKAVNATNQILEVANKNYSSGLQRAEVILLQVRERAPEQAREGLDNALNNVRDAQNREPPVQGMPDNTQDNTQDQQQNINDRDIRNNDILEGGLR